MIQWQPERFLNQNNAWLRRNVSSGRRRRRGSHEKQNTHAAAAAAALCIPHSLTHRVSLDYKRFVLFLCHFVQFASRSNSFVRILVCQVTRALPDHQEHTDRQRERERKWKTNVTINCEGILWFDRVKRKEENEEKKCISEHTIDYREILCVWVSFILAECN